MSDLISRSAVIELLRKNMTSDIQDQITTENNINLISSIPTAYSVEKVVAELEKQSYEIRLEGGALIGNWHSVIDTNIAIAKVRKGGVE